MDEDPAALRARAAAAIAEVDEMLDQRARRQMAGDQPQDPAQRPAVAAERVEWTPPAPEAPKPIARSVEPRQRPQQPVGGVDWEKTGVWVHGIVNKQIEAFAKEFGEGIGDELALIRKQERELLRGEFKAAIAELRSEFERRLLEAEHRVEVAELTRRLADAEQRSSAPKPPARPQLVAGGSDGAD